MFVGHLGAGLAFKKLEPDLNLGVLLFASLFLDGLLGFFMPAGFEQVVVPTNYTELHYLDFIFPFSHSLLAVAGWSWLLSGNGSRTYYDYSNNSGLRGDDMDSSKQGKRQTIRTLI